MSLALLVDGRNTAYRAYFAAKNNDAYKDGGTHYFVMWVKFCRTWVEKFKPTSVHVFWDNAKEDLWRTKIFKDYKGNRNQEPEVTEQLYKLEGAAKAILPLMNVRCYERDAQEADDLIYSACKLLTPNKSIVISSDSDMMQLPFYMRHVSCYEPRLAQMQPTPELSPVHIKSLMGDLKTDNIPGYHGIGEVKSAGLLRDPKAFQEFLKVRGDKIYKRNMALIDLSLNPYRLFNEMYVQDILSRDVEFSKEKIDNCIMDHKVKGLKTEYSRSVLPFKNLV